MDPHVRPSIFVSSSIAPGPIRQHLDQDQGTTLHREQRLLAYGLPTPPSPPARGAASHMPTPPPTCASPWPLQCMHVPALSAPPPIRAAPRHPGGGGRARIGDACSWRRHGLPAAAQGRRRGLPEVVRAPGGACSRQRRRSGSAASRASSCHRRLVPRSAQRRRPPQAARACEQRVQGHKLKMDYFVVAVCVV